MSDGSEMGHPENTCRKYIGCMFCISELRAKSVGWTCVGAYVTQTYPGRM